MEGRRGQGRQGGRRLELARRLSPSTLKLATCSSSKQLIILGELFYGHPSPLPSAPPASLGNQVVVDAGEPEASSTLNRGALLHCGRSLKLLVHLLIP